MVAGYEGLQPCFANPTRETQPVRQNTTALAEPMLRDKSLGKLECWYMITLRATSTHHGDD